MIIQATEKDFNTVYRILSHESVYPFLCDDYCPKKPDDDVGLLFLKDPAIKVLLPNEDSAFAFIPLSMNMYHIHLGILPESRGKLGVSSGKEAIWWMFENTECVSIIGFFSEENKPALRYCSLVGFKRIGIIEKSFKKNNIMYDQIIFNINKGDISCLG